MVAEVTDACEKREAIGVLTGAPMNAAVSIIPVPLRPFRFVLCGFHEKAPIEKGFTVDRNYAWDDPRLTSHIYAQKNYGVLCGVGGLVGLDFDDMWMYYFIRDSLPATFEVKSGSGKRHMYYTCDSVNGFNVTYEGRNLVEVHGAGRIMVAPGSIHPSGGIYEAVNDLPVVAIASLDVLKDKQIQKMKALGEALRPFWGLDKAESDCSHRGMLLGVGVMARRGEADIDVVVRAVIAFIKANPHSDGKIHDVDDAERLMRDGFNGEYKIPEGVPAGFFDAVARVLYADRPKVDVIEAADIAERVLAEYHIISVGNEMYVYRNGVYVSGARPYLAAWIEKNVKSVNSHLVNEALDHIERRTFVGEVKEADPLILNCANGLLSLHDLSFKEHTPDFISFAQLPVKYDPHANCPVFLKFIGEVIDPGDVSVIQEFFGYTLFRSYLNAKALMLVGDGANGKSTLLNVLREMLGPANVSADSLQELEINHFAKADLFGKLANIYPDLPQAALIGTSTFKALTGGDMVHVEPKFGHRFSFVNHAKLIFSTNAVPKANDDSDGFARRWVIVLFHHKFEGANADRQLPARLQGELSGVLNWAIDGLMRLASHNFEFSNSKSAEVIKEEYRRLANPVVAFFEDSIVISEDSDGVPKTALYEAYVKYVSTHKIKALQYDSFFAAFKPIIIAAIGEYKIEQRNTAGAKGARFVAGITLKGGE